jgi:hypothetical protein
MISLPRRLFCACVLILVAAGLYAGPVLSQQANGSGTVIHLAMMTAPAPLNTEALVPPLAEPVALLCGNRWVDTTYVLSNNCLKACLKNHTMADCTTSLVPLCQACWKHLQTCAADKAILPAEHCKVCTTNYAQCMKSFL